MIYWVIQRGVAAAKVLHSHYCADFPWILALAMWGGLASTAIATDEESSSPAAVASDEQPPTVVVDEVEVFDEGDRAPSSEAAEAVARELYEIQQQQGGSIVRQFQPPLYSNYPYQSGSRPAPPPSPAPSGRVRSPAPMTWPARQASWTPDNEPARAPTADPAARVHLLRESAWQLESVAHRLETAELYAKADAVRHLAQQLRIEARNQSHARTRPAVSQPGPFASGSASPEPAPSPQPFRE